MSRQLITIAGPIGIFKVGDRVVNGVTMVKVISKIAALPQDTTEIQIDISSPGGVKEVGDNIYNFLQSLKPQVKLIMNQIGNVGSIATKIWFAGDERIALRGINPETNKPYELFVHNPWMQVTGDAAAVKLALAEIEPQEEELRNFYMAQTGLPLEGIKPMMDSQTGIDADQALQMRFATGVREAINIAAYQINENENTMKIDEKEKTRLGGVLDEIKAYLFKKEPVKADITVPGTGAAPIVAAPADPKSALVGKTVMVDGQPAPDFVYTVKGGAVVSVEDIEVEEAEDSGLPTTLATSLSEIEKFLKNQKAAEPDEAKIKALVDEQVKAQVEAFKSTYKVSHVPVRKDVIIDRSTMKESPIQARNRENLEKQEKERARV